MKDFLISLFMIALILFMFIVIFNTGVAGSAEIPKERAVYAIIGEAEGEGFIGMLAVACAIRNRGTLKGVYGEQSSRVKNHLYSSKIFVQAVRAWEDSRTTENCDFIDGADHWEGTSFPTPYWAKDMVVTATIGNQRFYREKR